MIINGIKLLTDWNPYEDLFFFFLLDKPTIQNFGKKNYITKNVSTGSKRCKKKKKNIDTGIENIRS